MVDTLPLSELMKNRVYDAFGRLRYKIFGVPQLFLDCLMRCCVRGWGNGRVVYGEERYGSFKDWRATRHLIYRNQEDDCVLLGSSHNYLGLSGIDRSQHILRNRFRPAGVPIVVSTLPHHGRALDWRYVLCWEYSLIYLPLSDKFRAGILTELKHYQYCQGLLLDGCLLWNTFSVLDLMRNWDMLVPI